MLVINSSYRIDVKAYNPQFCMELILDPTEIMERLVAEYRHRSTMMDVLVGKYGERVDNEAYRIMEEAKRGLLEAEAKLLIRMANTCPSQIKMPENMKMACLVQVQRARLIKLNYDENIHSSGYIAEQLILRAMRKAARIHAIPALKGSLMDVEDKCDILAYIKKSKLGDQYTFVQVKAGNGHENGGLYLPWISKDVLRHIPEDARVEKKLFKVYGADSIYREVSVSDVMDAIWTKNCSIFELEAK